MSDLTYRIAKLAPGFDLGLFDCGEPVYNHWLNEHAMQAFSSGPSMVYLLLEKRPEASRPSYGVIRRLPHLVVRDEMPKPLEVATARRYLEPGR